MLFNHYCNDCKRLLKDKKKCPDCGSDDVRGMPFP